LVTQPAVLVTVLAVQGSAPRAVGTWMAVFPDAVLATVGGGRLEWEAIEYARGLLAARARDAESRRYPLGPALGQCCGGVVELAFEPVQTEHIDSLRQRLAVSHARPVAVFGGGHVGRALIQVLSALPYRLTWIDSRDGIFPLDVPDTVVCEHSDPVQAAVKTLAAGSRVLIMSFSHAEDLDIVATCLLRRREHGDLPYLGLIGSQTKWASFRHRLYARGFSAEECAGVVCPIGLPGINGKEPEVIAVSVAAQLLLMTP